MLGKVYALQLRAHEEGRTLSPAALAGELSGEEMSHLTTVLQRPEAPGSAEQALADYIRIIRERADQREGRGETDPLLAAMERSKEKKGYGGKPK